MKKYIKYILALLFTLFLGLVFGNFNTIFKLNETEVSFSKDLHDFGTIPQNEEVYTYFVVENIGGSPLKISDIEVKCGCTVADWNPNPIGEGMKDSIRVYYDAANIGYFSKEIRVHYNGTQSPQALFLTGTVSKD